MRNRLPARPLVTLLTLVLLLSLAPASIASASPSINLIPESGTVGTSVSIKGEGLEQNTRYDVYFSNQQVDYSAGKRIGEDVTRYRKVLNTTTTDFPDFNASFLVPENLDTAAGGTAPVFHDGPHHVYLTLEGETLILAGKNFNVKGFATARADSAEGNVGDSVTITGEGYLPGEYVLVKFNGVDITAGYVEGNTRVNSAGEFSVEATIPESVYGWHEIALESTQTEKKVLFDYRVLPAIKLSKSSGGAGDIFSVTGTGFEARSGVAFALDGEPVEVEWVVEEDARTGSTGKLVVNITVPDIESGEYEFTATDTSKPHITASGTFNVLPPPLDPSISISPASGKVGASVSITGTEFRDGRSIALTINGSQISAESPITTDSGGNFSGSFEIPELPGGSHTLKASDGQEEAAATLEVKHHLEMTPSSGKPGTEVSVTGSGLRPEAQAVVYFNAVPQPTSPVGAVVGESGTLAFTFIVPASPPGEHAVEVRAGTANLVATFTTAPEVVLSTQSPRVGEQMAVSSQGFAPNQPAIITFAGKQIATLATNPAGALNVVFTVPHVAEGTYQLKVEVAGEVVIKNVTTTAQVTLDPGQGVVGTQVNVIGIGFGPGKLIEIKWDGEPVEGSAGLRANDEGKFNVMFNVPVAAPGSYAINVSDELISKELSFDVEPTIPPAPAPVSPVMYARLSGEPVFEWKPVAYEYMDVTYEFQIIRNLDEPEVVLNETGLEETEYTLKKDVGLEHAGEDDPYYWRVRAVDEAGNTSAWSDAGEFYYGSSWPGWLTWLLVGLGVVILGVVIYLLRWRIAYFFY